ncbi:integrase core domain protein [Ancylostoma duodenale]|uniref:Integrase core domain protein n=1 Tax=Ancylostoma duodenale TaxID=51022 RepID=A0A0C2CC69_9BILA|nr:integrase core domain protein [Ancylostoma duodenale]
MDLYRSVRDESSSILLSASTHQSILMIVQAYAHNQRTGSLDPVSILLDSGAQTSFITNSTVSRLSLHPFDKRTLTTVAFGGHRVTEKTGLVDVQLFDSTSQSYEVRLYTKDVVAAPRHPQQLHPEDFAALRSNDIDPESLLLTQTVVPDILLGINYFWEVLCNVPPIVLPSGLVLSHTRFGPTVSGISLFVNVAQVVDHSSAERSVDSVTRLWDLDLLGITDDPDPSVDKDEDARILRRFQNTAEEIGGYLYVQFPWKSSHPRLADNKLLAYKRLESQYRTLVVKPQLWKDYAATFDDYLKQGIIEEVDEFAFDDHRVYYIPHQANTYVDNVILSANTPEEAIAKYRASKSLFKSMHMNLREFLCNSNIVNAAISSSDRIRNASSVKLLGIPWKPDVDTLVIPLKVVNQPVSTKRTALRALSSTFDPLGLLVPFLAPLKVFIQDTWKKKYQWDDPFDEEDLLQAQPLTMPRMELLAALISARLVRFVHSQLHRPIAAVHFFSDSQIALHWIHSSRPLKRFVNNRVVEIRSIISALQSSGTHVKFYYVQSDQNPADCASRGLSSRSAQNHIWWCGPSFLVLPPSEWPQAKCEFTLPPDSSGTHVKFYYVQSEQNPADCASRGLPTRSAQNHIWWCGPSFLVLPSSEWPQANCGFTLPPDVSLEVENEFQALTAIQVYSYQSPLRFQATNRYLKLVRSTAYVLKFIGALFLKIRHRPTSLNLSHSLPTKLINAVEFTIAETLLITEQYRESVHQLEKLPLHRFNAHRSADGLLRCPNRLEHSETSTISAAPVLLVPAHPFTTSVVMHHHLENFHSGVHATIASLRRRFYIPSIRSTVVKILRDCIVCKKANCLPYRYPDMPSLPPERVNRSRPFQKVGLDYLGPLYYRDTFHTKAKVWVCLFTCMATRAVHLEVVLDNTVQEFLLAFRRFVARRGTPDYVLSDNATTFRSASDTLHVIYTRAAVEKLTSEFTKRKITWKFITPLSPWKGGFYERLVGLFKSAFRKSVRRTLLPLQQFQTLVFEIEAVLNARPLLSIRDTCTAPHVLKPIDFISPEVDLEIPPSERSLASFPSHRLAGWYRETVSILDRFWNIWYKDYLSTIADRHQKRIRQGRSTSVIPKVSDVVLVAEKNVPRGRWPLGVITALGNVSNDGPRSATVRMPNGRLVQRSLNHLYPLEITAFEDQPEPKECKKQLSTRVQPPRAAKRFRSYSR